MKTKAFSYLRVSSRGQVEGDGFPRQRDAVAKFAKKQRIEVVCEYRDEVSGTKDAFDRPGLTDLLVAIKANGVRTILLERADRLARDIVISETILRECRAMGVKVIAADSGTDLTVADDDPTRVLVRQLLGVLAQWEKSCIVQKLRAARVRIRRTEGRCEGRKPYGLGETETKIVSDVLALRKAGYTNAAIAEKFNQEGLRPRTSQRAGKQTKWHATSVQRIITRGAKAKPTKKKQPRKTA